MRTTDVASPASRTSGDPTKPPLQKEKKENTKRQRSKHKKGKNKE
jgi:hypothetical protein